MKWRKESRKEGRKGIFKNIVQQRDEMKMKFEWNEFKDEIIVVMEIKRWNKCKQATELPKIFEMWGSLIENLLQNKIKNSSGSTATLYLFLNSILFYILFSDL